MATQVSDRRTNFRDKNFVPRLENGDRLTREEFHRRYESMPENVRAELIKGIVYMASPVKADHGKPQAAMMSFLSHYRIATVVLELLDNVTYVARHDYEPQPDVVLRIDEKAGGKSWINDGGYLEGSPELVVEISSSSVSYDLHDKLEMYEAKGVQEYVVWRVLDEQIDWFVLANGKYKKLHDNDGIIESRIFPGLRLNTAAMIEGDLRTVVRDLDIAMSGKDYIEFARNLSE